MKTLLELFEMTQQGSWSTAGKDTQYRIKIIDGTQYVIFQTSISREDWIANFMAWPCHGIHVGYRKRYIEARLEVLRNVALFPTVFLGYSHGAALALLFHIQFQQFSTAVLFACPRVMCQSRAFDSLNVTRYSVCGDPVPHLPPWVLGFRHVGCNIKIGKQHVIWPSRHFPAEYRKAIKEIKS